MAKQEFFHPCFEYSEHLKEGEKVFLPTVRIVCPACDGYGTHERQDIDCSLIVDSYYEDGDYEALERYRNGAFDVPCTCCNGKNVIDEVDMEYFYDNYPELYEEMCDWDRAEAEDARYSAQERAMGA